MKVLLPVIALLLLAAWSSGCRDSTSPESGANPLQRQLDGPKHARQLERDIAAWERAAGQSHGMTPDEIRKMMQKARAAPVFKNRFLGIRTLQNPSDAWIIMEIMHEVRPDLIVETGTYHGGSAALWAIVLEHINPEGRVITIDVEDQRERRAVELPISRRRVDFLLGSSTAPEIVREVQRRAQGKRVLVLLDSLHSKEHVAAELAAYAPLVPVGSYVIVQDTPAGPLPAIEEFLSGDDSFVADRARERYADTNTVRGYLKRVR